MDFLDIGDLAAKTGLRPSALRHYEEVGLIRSVARHGLRRQFPPETLLQLRLIALAKAAGFPLAEIAQMLGRNGTAALPRATLHRRADQIEAQIGDLATLRDTLRHIADCAAPSHMECPKFRHLLLHGRVPEPAADRA